jgi:nucleotide-binding universal stress UspA family protein
MKSLLVCTDFSEASEHAAKYACMFAVQYQLRYITLFHAYQTFIPAMGLPAKGYDNNEAYNFSVKQLKDLQEKIELLAGNKVSIKIRADDVNLGEGINRICEKENAEMVVMGMKGKSNFEKAITGSNAISVAKNSYYPVLIVPVAAALKSVERMLIACDLSKSSKTIPTDLVKEMLTLFNAPLTVLNVDYNNKHFSPETPDHLYHIHHLFDKYGPEYAFTENKDISLGILEYAEQHDISIIVAMPRNYNFFERLFHKSATEGLIYRTSIPLLTLHAPQK